MRSMKVSTFEKNSQENLIFQRSRYVHCFICPDIDESGILSLSELSSFKFTKYQSFSTFGIDHFFVYVLQMIMLCCICRLVISSSAFACEKFFPLFSLKISLLCIIL